LKTWFYILLTLILFVQSCKKEQEYFEPNTYYYLSEEFKDEFLFSAGSYWVYRNNQNETDSIVLEQIETGFTSGCPDNLCGIREFYELTYNNTDQGLTYNNYYTPYLIKYNGGGSFGHNGQPIFFHTGELGDGYHGAMIIDHFDSLAILGHVFYSVDVIKVTAEDQYQNEFEYDTELYFSPYVGLVKQVTFDTINGTGTWELDRYHIN